MAIHGADKVVRDLNDFIRNFEKKSDDVGVALRKAVVDAIFKEQAIDTAAMVIAIDYSNSYVTDTGIAFFVGTIDNPDVYYDGFVEFPTANRDGTTRRGRFFYKQGIENTDFARLIDQVATESFVI